LSDADANGLVSLAKQPSQLYTAAPILFRTTFIRSCAMSTVDESALRAALKGVIEPALQRDLISLDAVSQITIDGDHISVEITLGYPADSISQELAESVHKALSVVSGVSR